MFMRQAEAGTAVGQPDEGSLEAEQASEALQAAMMFPAHLQRHGVDDRKQEALAAIWEENGIEA
jgi:hypothetical protein